MISAAARISITPEDGQVHRIQAKNLSEIPTTSSSPSECESEKGHLLGERRPLLAKREACSQLDPNQERSDSSECVPENATIFKSVQQVVEWRENERNRSCRYQDDEKLPRTDGEKAATGRALFKAFKSTTNGQPSDLVMKHFMAQAHGSGCIILFSELYRLSLQRKSRLFFSEGEAAVSKA